MRFESRAHSGFEPGRHVKPWTDGATGCMAALRCHRSKGAGNRRTPVGIALMFLDFESLRLTSRPNQFLVAPKGLTQAAPHEESPVFAVAVERLCNAFAAMIKSQPRVEIRLRSEDGRRWELVQLSRLFRFADDVSVRFIDNGNGTATLAIYSRSRLGYGDLGVNRRRVQRWLALLQAELAPRQGKAADLSGSRAWPSP